MCDIVTLCCLFYIPQIITTIPCLYFLTVNKHDIIKKCLISHFKHTGRLVNVCVLRFIDNVANIQEITVNAYYMYLRWPILLLLNNQILKITINHNFCTM